LPRRWTEGDYYQSVPLPVQGGIAAQTKRGEKFGASWWGARWIAVLESFGWESRLQRGRRYARLGQVLGIDLAPGHVRAQVQGSRPRPYTVTIDIPPLTDAAWEQVTLAMADRASFSARLLAGEMPPDIEEAFGTAGVSLFPTSAREMRTHCTCPDVANPCKHIAAVYYLLGESFDRDPFVLFRLRGRTQEEIVAALRSLRAAAATGEEAPADVASAGEEPAAPEPEPLEAALAHFWQPGDGLHEMHFAIAPPEVPQPLLRRLGEPPFFPGLAASLAPLYDAVTRAALDLAFGEQDEGSLE